MKSEIFHKKTGQSGTLLLMMKVSIKYCVWHNSDIFHSVPNIEIPSFKCVFGLRFGRKRKGFSVGEFSNIFLSDMMEYSEIY